LFFSYSLQITLVLFTNRYYTVITTIVKEVIMASFKKLLFLASLAGAAAAGVSYVLKYKGYQKELEGEFKDFDDELDENTDNNPSDRKYTELKSSTDEFVTAAKDTANSAKGMASAAKEVLKGVANIVSDNVAAATDVAKDSAKPIFDKAKDKFDKATKKSEDDDSEVEVDFYEMNPDEDKKDLAQKIDDVLEDDKK
jgi:hypothetical protein